MNQTRSNDDLRDSRLKNLAEAIAELKAEADEENKPQQQARTLVQINAQQRTREEDDEKEKEEEHQEEKPAAPKAAAPAPPPLPPVAPAPAAQAAPNGANGPRNQGTRRGDLVALYRFEDRKNPGRGLGGPGRNLKVYGQGIQVVHGPKKGDGRVAKRGRGALFVPARPTTAAAVVDPKNPFQNSFLARSSKGAPIAGLPKGDESFTLTAWFKLASTKVGQFGLLSLGKQQSNAANTLKATSGGQAVASFKTGAPLKSTNADATEKKWTHAAVTWEQKTKEQKIYINGKLAGQRTLTTAPSVASVDGAFFLGVTSNGPDSEQFTGFLDDVAIFRRALSDDEIVSVGKGRFYPYLDLFALRDCSTRIGHRQHGGGFTLGGPADHLNLNATTGKYGFAAKNAFECSSKCAQTIDCLQAVFYADAASAAKAAAAHPVAPANAANAQVVAQAAANAHKITSGICYLMKKSYETFTVDKSATSTVCRKPSKQLKLSSATLKGSLGYVEKAKPARKAQGAPGKLDANLKRDAFRAGVEKRRLEAKIAAMEKKQKADKARRSAKAAKLARKTKNSAVTQKRNAKRSYNSKLKCLRAALKAKSRALRELKRQATNRRLRDAKRAEDIIAKLTRRLKIVTKKLEEKDDEHKTLALAAKIKLEADRKAESIIQAAEKRLASVKRAAKKEHRRRLRRRIEAQLNMGTRVEKKAKKAIAKAKKIQNKIAVKKAKAAAKKAAKKAKKAAKAAKKKETKADRIARKAAKKADKKLKQKIHAKASSKFAVKAQEKAVKMKAALRRARKAADAAAKKAGITRTKKAPLKVPASGGPAF